MDKAVGKMLEVRTESGELLFKLRLILRDETDLKSQPEEKKPVISGKFQGEKQANNQTNSAHEPMTDAQKRFLFRILAGHGIEENAAYEELKKAFGVDSLKNVTKYEACQEIKKRLAAKKGGAVNGSA